MTNPRQAAPGPEGAGAEPRHSFADLYELRLIPTPTIANALECMGVNPAEGYTGPEVTCFTPELGTMVGYATTARAMASAPRDAAHPGVEDAAYWRYVASLPGPKVAVVQDLDSTPVGSIWGEVNASRHRALGCVGMLTHGAVRDIDEVTRLGFFAYAHCLVVSHAFAHWVDYGLPVVVASLTIRSGDLLHGDKHGVLLIPPEIPLGDLIRIAREVDRLEREIIGYSLSPLPTVEGVIRVSESVTARWPSWGGASPGLDVMF